jgi:hypothetical protein
VQPAGIRGGTGEAKRCGIPPRLARGEARGAGVSRAGSPRSEGLTMNERLWRGIKIALALELTLFLLGVAFDVAFLAWMASR